MYIWILLALAAAAVLGLSAIFASRLFQAKVEKEIARYQTDYVQKHSEEVENMYRETRGWRHDLKTHIQTMKAHLALGGIPEAGGVFK